MTPLPILLALSLSAPLVRSQQGTVVQIPAAVPVSTWGCHATGDKARLVKKLRELDAQAGAVTWAGDSITEQGVSGTGFTTYIETAYPGITYSNQAVGGHTTEDMITFLTTITNTEADLYVVAIGVNDARYNDSRGATTASEYVANVTTIVNALKAAGGEVALVSIWPTWWEDAFSALGRAATDARYVAWNAALRSYASGAGVMYIDVYNPLMRTVDLSNVVDLIPDGVHPDWDGAAFVDTVARPMYARAVLCNSIRDAEWHAEYEPTGTNFYKLVIPDNGASSDWISVQNIAPAPSVSESFAYSANAAVDATGLFGDYNADVGGFLNKAGDWPVVMTFSGPSALTAVITAPRARALGIRAWQLYSSTSPAALTDPNHFSWTLDASEATTTANAHNLKPSARAGVYYRLQVDSSKGTDGTGGQTGTYVKIHKVWTGTPPVRWVDSPVASPGDKLRTDLIFSATGGDAAAMHYLSNSANTYPYHIMWEAEGVATSITLASDTSGGASARGIKRWWLYSSTDPDAITSTAHASWDPVVDGTYDQTAVFP